MIMKENYSKLMELLEETHKRLYSKNWHEYDSKTFSLHLTRTIDEIEEMEKILARIHAGFHAKGMHDSIGLKKEIDSLDLLLVYLKKQLELEEKKSKKLSNAELVEQVLSENQKQLYSSIEQKVLSELLKLRHFTERLFLFIERREEHPLKAGTGKNIMILLEQKEKELHELKEKFNELRSKKGVFSLEEKNSIEKENEVNELARKIEKETEKASAKIKENRQKLDEINANTSLLAKQVSSLDEMVSQQALKSMELITELKKEKDYFQKLALETEHETSIIRSQYSQKLIGLEKEKISAKEEAKEKFEKRINELENELKKKNELNERLQKIIERGFLFEKKKVPPAKKK
ncbi:MAG: hypothetical protein ABIA76_06015 [Candidatus Diapherotrites archaeon]